MLPNRAPLVVAEQYGLLASESAHAWMYQYHIAWHRPIAREAQSA